MRIFFLSAFTFCFQFFGFGQNSIDVIHYKFNIGLNDLNDSIHGVAEIKVKALQAINELSLDLTNAGNGNKGMKVEKLLGNSIRGYIHKENKLRIILGQKLKTGDSATLTVSYSGIPADGLIISKTKYGRRGFFADNWPDRGHNWIPCHDDPADKATVEFIVTAPEHYQVVANGIQIGEPTVEKGFKKTVWKEDTPISTKVMVIGVADFAIQLAGVVNGNIPVYSWVYPENKNEGFYDYAIAKDILPFYINNVGPYGYKKLANVQSKTKFGGLENANTIFYSEGSVSGKGKNFGLLAHEIAHQWFGNMATEKSFGHLWLSEGFATYFTILYFENRYGRDTAIQMLLEDRQQVIEFSKTNKKAVVDTAETDYMNLLNPNSYQKGGWVLHMLRSQLGDSVFWRSIRKYYSTYAGSVADTRDLQKIFETVSGKDLKQFFDQWLYTPGQPELDIKWSYNSQSGETIINVRQMQAGDFEFPLKIEFKYRSDKKVEKVYMDKKAMIFTIKTTEKPMSLIVDPNVELLIKYSVQENQ